MLNTTEYWKKVMVALPDDEFFAIMRNYLGKLKTPFNKHTLIDDLADFLLREETENRILSLIDQEDALILTSINFLTGTDIHELHEFLGSDRSFMSIHHILLNLEERLLIYRDSDSGRIKISPLFENLFKKKVFDSNLLFPSIDCNDNKFPELWFTDSLITAFISYIYKTPDILKLDGTIKKKAQDEINYIFSSLFENEKSGTRISLLLKSLKNLSLLEDKHDELSLSEDNLKEFSLTQIKDRYMLYAASIVTDDIPYSLISNLADVIEDLISAIPFRKSFDIGSIKKLLLLIIKKSSLNYLNSDSILDALISLKFLVLSKKRYVINPHLNEQLLWKEFTEPPIIVQPSFDLTVKPWLNLKDGIKFACLTDIKKFDLYPDYELNRASYTRGHDSKLHSSSIIITLEELSARPIPQNILVSVDSWEEDYNRVKIYEGIILSVNPDKRIIIQHLTNLQPFIREELSDGIYLMDTNSVKEWKTIIENAGISVPGIQKNQIMNESPSVLKYTKPFKSSNIIKIPETIPIKLIPDSNFQEKLNTKLDSLKLNQTEKNGFKIRISKKLILFPDQIQHGNIRTEKTEASGMDYIGKIRLIERTLESNSELLEVTFGSPIEKLSTYLVKPINLDKSNEDLLLNAITLPEEDKIELIVRKMSKVKRLKSSLFAPPTEKADL
ncbi:MAG: hypothetical protein PF693_03645 [Spirochaetia bacterium]|jgi:hypothetical protein|nr:hypothetical protein [Spirochaetia bacterium]